MDASVYGCMDGWMDGSMYACMHVCRYACMHVLVCVDKTMPHPKKNDKKRKNDGRTKVTSVLNAMASSQIIEKTLKKSNVKTYPFKRVALKLRKQVLIANDGMQVNGLA
jgi:hypothetical protein